MRAYSHSSTTSATNTPTWLQTAQELFRIANPNSTNLNIYQVISNRLNQQTPFPITHGYSSTEDRYEIHWSANGARLFINIRFIDEYGGKYEFFVSTLRGQQTIMVRTDLLDLWLEEIVKEIFLQAL